MSIPASPAIKTNPFDVLKESLNEAMTWSPNIMIKTSHFKQLDDGTIIPSYQDSFNIINVISLLQKQSCSFLDAHRQCKMYPSNGILELEEFKFCEDKDTVISYMKSVCLIGHSTMSIRTSNTNQSSE
jgi:hypothetical protein